MLLSPYTPGAGKRPPVLAGRTELLTDWKSALAEVDAVGRLRAPDLILVGPRGIGKTAAVTALSDISIEQGYEVIELQAAAGNPGLVDGLLRRAQTRLDSGSGPWDRAKRAFERLGGVTFTVLGTGGAVSIRENQTAPHAPTPEDLAGALAALAEEVRRDHPHGGVLVTIDEMQVAPHADLTLLAAALHVLNRAHQDAQVMFVGAGLPHTGDVLDAAGVTHADRLFDIRPLPLLLEPRDARYAILEASRQRQVSWDPVAVDRIAEVSLGYPAHLQTFADEAWIAAPGPDTITMTDAEAAIPIAAAKIERRTLGPRFDRRTPREIEFLTALAMNGSETSMAALARTLDRSQSRLSNTRDVLLKEGDIFVPRRGAVALTVPLFAPYLLRNYDALQERSTIKLEPRSAMAARVSGPPPPPRLDSGGASRLPPAPHRSTDQDHGPEL